LNAVMPLFTRRASAVTASTALDGPPNFDARRTASFKQAKQAPSRIERALAIMAARREAGQRVMEIQLVAQAIAGSTAPERYNRWRKDWDRRLRASGPWDAHEWPPRLASDELAMLIAPFPAGRVGPALRAAKLAAQPMFVAGRFDEAFTSEHLLGVMVADWLHWTPDGVAAIVAPPVIEEVAGGRVARTRVVSLGVDWPLPAPDGV
jgi:hypothetical protein